MGHNSIGHALMGPRCDGVLIGPVSGRAHDLMGPGTLSSSRIAVTAGRRRVMIFAQPNARATIVMGVGRGDMLARGARSTPQALSAFAASQPFDVGLVGLRRHRINGIDRVGSVGTRCCLPGPAGRTWQSRYRHAQWLFVPAGPGGSLAPVNDHSSALGPLPGNRSNQACKQRRGASAINGAVFHVVC